VKPRWIDNLLAFASGLAVLLASLWPGSARAAYASDFTLANHRTGQPARLSDFAGSIVVLDFFSPYCAHCQAAAPDIRTNIHQYYLDLAGNASGLPVTVIAINELTNRAAADAFIASNHLDLVLDDTPDRAVFNQFGGVTLPHFVVINAITNNVNYPAWQILGYYYGYAADSTTPALRGYIEAVRGTLSPSLKNFRLAAGPVFTAQFTAQKGRTNWIDATSNWVDWITITNLAGSNAVLFFDPGAALSSRRFYRVRIE
jgi:thiol-disulfide isomerase/thioredoxin